MKKSIFFTIVILAVVSMLNSCTTPPMEAAQESYDYDAIIPKIFAVDGPTQTAASGLAPVRYVTSTRRGGSTLTWTVTGHGATITAVEGDAFAIDILFDQSDVDVDDVQVTCVETTMGGVSSDPFVVLVDLKKFKPMSFDQFLGDWSFVETVDGEEVATGTVTITDGGGGTLKLPAVDGIPTLMSHIFLGWGESFQAGHGNDGAVYITPNLASGAVAINGQYWGQTLPGPYDYWIHGDGNWEGINQTMTLSYGIDWDDSYSDSWTASVMVLTKL
ncbi:hypothetical protein [uncultured Draconibacterium sp.]|uniref:hypothetical protein n=1 Tax=uncultured Draconibacterium sp. TaxID=1573823 RepID=UPI003217D169